MSDIKEPLLPQDEPPPSYSDNSPPKKPALAGARPPLPRPPFPLDLPFLNAIRHKRVILASASPRRKQLLSQLGLPTLEILPSTLPEDLSKTLSPFEYALRTAEQKALHVYKTAIAEVHVNPALGDPALLIAADTVVVGPNGSIYEKPRSAAEHVRMLKALRDAPGGKHHVVTGVAVIAPLESARDPGYRLLTAVEESTVVFDAKMSDEMVEAYVKTREGADKAGGYGIQGLGAVLVERLEGSWENVMGLPLRVTLGLIEKCLEQGDELEEEFGKEEGDDLDD